MDFLKDKYDEDFINIINKLNEEYEDNELTNPTITGDKYNSINYLINLHSYFLIYSLLKNLFNIDYANSILEQLFNKTLSINNLNRLSTGEGISYNYSTYEIAKYGFVKRDNSKSTNLSSFIGQVQSYIFNLIEANTDEIVLTDLPIVLAMFLERLQTAKEESDIPIRSVLAIRQYFKIFLRQLINVCSNHSKLNKHKQVVIALYDKPLLESMLDKYELDLSHKIYKPRLEYVQDIQEMILDVVKAVCRQKVLSDSVKVKVYFAIQDKKRLEAVKELSEYSGLYLPEANKRLFQIDLNNYTEHNIEVLTKACFNFKSRLSKHVTYEGLKSKLITVLRKYNLSNTTGKEIVDRDFYDYLEYKDMWKSEIVEYSLEDLGNFEVTNTVSNITLDCSKIICDKKDFLNSLRSVYADAHTLNIVKKLLLDNIVETDTTVFSLGYVDYTKLSYNVNILNLDKTLDLLEIEEKDKYILALEGVLTSLNNIFKDTYGARYSYKIVD